MATRKSPLSLSTLTVLLLLLPLAVAARADDPQGRGETVELTVIVHDDQQPVHGLSAADFEVRQNRRQATVLRAEAVIERQWMFFFDLASSGADWVEDAQIAALDLAHEGLASTDRVGVAIHGIDGKLLVVRPSHDRVALERAIAAIGKSQAAGALQPNADQIVATEERAAQEAGNLGEGTERGLAYAGQNRVASLAQSLQGLAGMLDTLGNNNHIVVFSSGVDLSIALGNDRTQALDQERIASAAEAAARGDVTRTTEIDSAQGGVVEQAVLQATEEAARRGCSIHGVAFSSTESSGPKWAAQGPEGLWFLAERTGGELVRDPADLSSAFSAMLERTSLAYRLQLQPAKLKKGGGFHPVTVTLADSQYEVDAAPGFYAPGL